jgi:hypothetical protein
MINHVGKHFSSDFCFGKQYVGRCKSAADERFRKRPSRLSVTSMTCHLKLASLLCIRVWPPSFKGVAIVCPCIFLKRSEFCVLINPKREVLFSWKACNEIYHGMFFSLPPAGPLH